MHNISKQFMPSYLICCVQTSSEDLKLFPTDDLEAEFLEETQRNKCQTDIFPVAEVWVNEGKEKETM